MKPYLLTVVISFLLGCIFYFAHLWSLISGSEIYAFRVLAVIAVTVFIIAVITVVMKRVFKRV